MKQISITTFAMLIVIAAVTHIAPPLQAANGPPVAKNEQVKEIADSNNAFAFDLYGRLAAEKGNLFLSPYSIHAALAMTYAGARGQTADQMARVLRLPAPPDKLHSGYAALIADLNSGGKVRDRELYKLVVANALFGQQGYPFHEPFQRIVREHYAAGLFNVDYVKATEAARRQINDWVATQTDGKIKDLIAPGVLDAMTRLVLANAIYFKSNWEKAFEKSATQERPFHLADGKTVNVPMMNQQHKFGYAESDELQLLEMPYRGHQLSMVVLLPRKVDGLPALEKTLTAATLDKLLAALRVREVNVTLPKFKFTSQFSLADTLKAMGMTGAFSPQQADFSGIATIEQLYISAVIHKAYVEVNEEGTEAAAATAVVVSATGFVVPEPPVYFKADHPFLFLIRHRASNTILFLGRVENPKT